MRILVTIQVTKPSKLADNALRWVARAGYDFMLFCQPWRHNRVLRAINDANYHYYLNVDEQNIAFSKPEIYAPANGYDLILRIPEGLESWRKGSKLKPAEILHFAKAVGAVRKQFSEQPSKQVHRWPNGAVMERVDG